MRKALILIAMIIITQSCGGYIIFRTEDNKEEYDKLYKREKMLIINMYKENDMIILETKSNITGLEITPSTLLLLEEFKMRSRQSSY